MLITSLIVLWNTGPPTQDSPTHGKNYAIKLEKKNDWKDAFVDIMSLIFQRTFFFLFVASLFFNPVWLFFRF